ncbi:uncharacterized protein FIBRA_04593 [Fibroporia radiculosa]|uniref:Calcineurin-like phosphoesterase domain-containing protein n=1 Tax=Fibroporia radiculosa TaxID=599839 RepID=J4HWL9_9APHY|nr:uncharacterized protein FIBRA_04593 [Fibroporia radiculosa]CCM02492.1 predicted protein [Fibroporia radiculosa]
MFELNVLLLFLLTAPDVFAAPTQVPMDVAMARPRKLQGRFLHITDIHPDPYYKEDRSEKSACHRKKPKKATPRSGYYGMPFSECDSPFTLTNYTLNFLENEWAPNIDFVVWTGDSARHDNDRKNPRTTDEIYMLNRVLARKMEDVFLSKGIPVIPTIGNNDIWLHTYIFRCVWEQLTNKNQNIMLPGPNSVTSEFSSIWRSFVPFESYQVFQRGGYFSVEVIPNSVAVISLNTMYLYDSNKDLALRYQDTILGHLYGHMNVDHFFFIDGEHIRRHPKQKSPLDISDEPQAQARKGLYKTLLKDFEDIPRASHNTSYDNYGVVNVSPSVVPNPYLPSFRIFTYNISGSPYTPAAPHSEPSTCSQDNSDYSWKRHLSKPWHSNPDSPSRTNKLWSPLGYAQYYLPGLASSSQKRPPKFKLEYLTFAVSQLHPSGGEGAEGFTYPVPLRHLPRSLRNATVTASKFAPYGLADLTIPSWADLARRLAEGEDKQLRKRFRRYMYMGADEA